MALIDPVFAEKDPCAAEGKICMCHVCECGMHKCPVKHTSSLVHYPPNTKSEYSHKYPAWPVPKKVAHKPPAAVTNDAPFVGITTHKSDYYPKKIPDRHKQVRPTKTLHECVPKGDYSKAATEYTARYEPKPLQPRFAPKKPEVTNNGARFDGTTTHMVNFQKWPIRPRAPIKPHDSGKDTGPFFDETTYKVAYWDKSKLVHPLQRLEKKNLPPALPFHGETTHHADYGAKPIPKKVAPLKHDTSLGKSDAKFEGETTYHANYKTWEISKPKRGHVFQGNLSTGQQKFSGETLYNTEFKPPKLPKRCPVLFRPRPQKVLGDHFVY